MPNILPADLDHPHRHAGLGHEGAMGAVVEDDVFPDLVRDRDQVVAHTDAGQCRDLVGIERSRRRVVRIVEHHKPGARPHRRRDGLLGQPPQRRDQTHRPRHAARPLDQRPIGVIGGLEQQHLVARIDERHQGGGQGLGRARGDHHPFDGKGHALKPPIVFDHWFDPVIRASAASRLRLSGPWLSGKP
jgi:hypothetical protein